MAARECPRERGARRWVAPRARRAAPWRAGRDRRPTRSRWRGVRWRSPQRAIRPNVAQSRPEATRQSTSCETVSGACDSARCCSAARTCGEKRASRSISRSVNCSPCSGSAMRPSTPGADRLTKLVDNRRVRPGSTTADGGPMGGIERNPRPCPNPIPFPPIPFPPIPLPPIPFPPKPMEP